MADNDPAFVDVIVEATGRTESVPADWVGHPVLGVGITLVPVAADPVDPSEAPTERNTVEEIDTFADKHGIDLGDAGTKAEKVAVINDALAAALPPAPPEVPAGNPDVQTAAGQASTESPYPAVAQQHLSTAGTEPSDETPATGDEEI
jgi:hypothetical protein